MATEPRPTGLTYGDLQAIPDDNTRRELIDGELFVTPAPSSRHQWVVGEVFHHLRLYAGEHGGRPYPAPTDVVFTDENVVQPDVLFVRAENLSRVEQMFIRSAPDVVVEVSSSSTRKTDLSRKKDLYERFGVPEYWFVDMGPDRIEVYRLAAGRYGPPTVLGRSDTLDTPLLPGFSVPVDELLGPPEA